MSSDVLIREMMRSRKIITQFITNFTNLLTKISMIGLDGLDLANLTELHEILLFSRKNNFNMLSEHVELLEEAIKQHNKEEMINCYLYISNWFFLFKKQYDYMTISAEMITESEELNLKQSISLKEELNGIFIPLKIFPTSKDSEVTNEFECQIIGVFQIEKTTAMLKCMRIQEKLTFYDEIFYKDALFGRHVYSAFFNLNIQNYSEYIQHTFYLTKFAQDESSSLLVKLINSQIQTSEELKSELLSQDLLLSAIKKFDLRKKDFLHSISQKQEIIKISLPEDMQLHITPLVESLLWLNFTEKDEIPAYLINIDVSHTPAEYDIFALNRYNHWILVDFDPFSILPPIETVLTVFYPVIDKILSIECSVTDLYVVYLFFKISTATNINKNLYYGSILKTKLLNVLVSFKQNLNLLELEMLLTMTANFSLPQDISPLITRYIEIVRQLSTNEQNDPKIQLASNYFIYYCIRCFNKNTVFLSFHSLLSKSLVPVRKTKHTQLAHFLYKSNRDAFIDFINFDENKFIKEWRNIWSKRHTQNSDYYEKIFLYKVNQLLTKHKIFVNTTDARIKSIILLAELIKNGLASSISVLEELYFIFDLK